jgi:ribonucleoside-diphosphate reductase alpha chain
VESTAVSATSPSVVVVDVSAPLSSNGHGNGHAVQAKSENGNGRAYNFIARSDAPTCAECGSIMIPNGSCHKCINCGTTSGCS